MRLYVTYLKMTFTHYTQVQLLGDTCCPPGDLALQTIATSVTDTIRHTNTASVLSDCTWLLRFPRESYIWNCERTHDVTCIRNTDPASSQYLRSPLLQRYPS